MHEIRIAPTERLPHSAFPMGCCRDPLSWLSPVTAISSKPSVIAGRSSNPTEFSSSSSSSGSYVRRWYNPVSRRRFGLCETPDATRTWIDANVDLSVASQDRFTVASYNILGDKNALKHRDLYKDVSSLYLTWDYRKKNICDELVRWNPDIICLQEVDRYFDLLNIMEKAGYVGSYKVLLVRGREHRVQAV